MAKVAYNNQTTTVRTIKGSRGFLNHYHVSNPNAATTYYVQFFDTTGAVTLGTTVPDFWFAVPTGAMASRCTYEFTNGLKMAVTTTYNGSTAPATGFDIALSYS